MIAGGTFISDSYLEVRAGQTIAGPVGNQEFMENADTRTYKAEETDVPAAAKTVDISAWAKERKDWTTMGSN